MRAAEIVDHPHTTAHVVSVLAVAELTAGLREAAMPLAMAGRAIAQHHGFTYWSAWCGIILADLEPGRSTTRVLCALTRAIRDYEATSARQALPFSYMLLANRALDDGQDSAALDALDHGLQAADATGVACYTPELLRLYSICRYQLGFGDFRNHLRQARRKAAQGDAKLFEKRIASTMLEIPLR